MRKLLLTLVLTMMMTAAGCGTQTEEIATEQSTITIVNNNTTINTTMMNNCYFKEQFKGNARIEQMFVVATFVDSNDNYVVVLEDTSGNTWEYENIDLYCEEDVLALLVDNNTEDITDDVIVHFWLGLE